MKPAVAIARLPLPALGPRRCGSVHAPGRNWPLLPGFIDANRLRPGAGLEPPGPGSVHAVGINPTCNRTGVSPPPICW